MRKKFLKGIMFRTILCAALLGSSAFSAQLDIDKENRWFDHPTPQSPFDPFRFDDPAYTKTPPRSPNGSPSKNSANKMAVLGVLNTNLSKSPTSSPGASPLKGSPNNSPTKEKVRESGTSPGVSYNRVKSPAQKKLFEEGSDKGGFDMGLASPLKGSPNNSPTKEKVRESGTSAGVNCNRVKSPIHKKLFDDVIDKSNNSNNSNNCNNCNNSNNSNNSYFNMALALSRETKQKQHQIAQKKNYLCAVPSVETNKSIEVIFQGACDQSFSSSLSQDFHNLVKLRSPHTVLNCGVKEWPLEMPFHMSLDLTKTDELLDGERIRSALNKVEFPFKEISPLGRFIVIRLKEPSVKSGHNLSDEDMKFLKKYLQYSGEEPVMHVSLVKVNDHKIQMACVAQNANQVEVPISPFVINEIIERATNKRKHIHMAGIVKTLSDISFWQLYLAGQKVTDHLSKIYKIEGKENAIYSYVHNQAILSLHNFGQLPAVAQNYFFKEYGVNYDFTDQIGIKLEGGNHYPITKDLVIDLFSSLFLNYGDGVNKPSEEFKQFQRLMKFCVSETKSLIEKKIRESEGGAPKINGDWETFGDFFYTAVDYEALSPRTISRYLKENEDDREFLNGLKEDLALFLIKDKFFGLTLDNQFFVEFTLDNQDLFGQVQQCQVAYQAPSESLLQLVQVATREALKGNYLDRKFSMQQDFDFRKFVDSIPAFLCISEYGSDQLTTLIAEEMEKVINENTDKLRDATVETVSFFNSKISDAPFWNNYIKRLQGYCDSSIYGTMFHFAEVSHQPSDDLDDEDDQ